MAFAKKSLGQNFLMHAQTAERIVAAANVPTGATVLEIGPGTGMLTRALLDAGLWVIAVEADGALLPTLEEAFTSEIGEGRLRLVHADIRAFDASNLPAQYHVVANIPYYITGELIRMFLSGAHKPRSMTLLVQKEVAERITRDPKGSLLSIAVKAYGTPIYRFTVPRGAFKPAPTVDSAVLHIQGISGDSFASLEEEAWFFEVLRTGFGHKRKQLAKNLEALAPRHAVLDALRACSRSEKVRAEDLSLHDWIALARSLRA
ncbi:MAG TPA: 16S rRNA (adenine(1518)-N(6)/adenine(1519)-N(6))-dimethyltransferase RsmA [Candidatus Paceibacterota bacterium]|nr:16S rRNA (adenine(1518)-N(6)/adenine(1519)-N(6))-dimethyltransferase RsmA [Candidatus Paceibacterota bacterium]